MGDSPVTGQRLDESGALGVAAKVIVAGIIALFMAAVFVLFLQLYVKLYWWRRGRRDAHPARRFGFGQVQRGQPQAAAAAQGGGGLDAAVLRSLPVFVVDPAGKHFNEGSECAVCLCELSPGQKGRVLPKCSHGFHVECIDMWLHSHSTCPLCRSPVLHPDGVCASESPSPPSPVDGPGSAVSVHPTESPDFPTNVLFWGDQTRIASRTSPEVSSSQSPPLSSPPLSPSPRPPPPPPPPSSSSGGSKGSDGMLVIDIPSRQSSVALASDSSSAARFCSGEEPSPIATGLRTLRRLLSRDRRTITACSPSRCSVDDPEQGNPAISC